MTQTIYPLFGTGTVGRSKFVSDQRRVNVYIEQQTDSDKVSPQMYGQRSQVVMYGRPGLTAQTVTYSDPATAAAPVHGQIRGMIGCSFVQVQTGFPSISQAPLVFVNGNTIYTWAANPAVSQFNGLVASATPLPTSSGIVQMADNGNQVIAVDGIGGYTVGYNTSTTAIVPANPLGPITDADFPLNPTTVAFLADRFIVNDPSNPGRFYWSDPLDGTSWDGLNYATAESNPDPLTRLFESGGQLLVIGTRTTEFWAPQTTGAQYARVGGSGIDWGTTAINSVCKFQGGVVMLARNLGGARQVVAISGYTPQVISTPSVENAINADPAPDGAVASVTTVNGVPFYILNLTNTSWVFNGQAGTWDEWQTNGGRWAGQFIAPNFTGGQFVSDYRTDTFYTLDSNSLYDGTQSIIRDVYSRHLLNNFDRITVDKLTIDAQVGTNSVVALVNPIAADFSLSPGSAVTTGGAGAVGASFTVQCWTRLVNTTPFTLLIGINGSASTVWSLSFDGANIVFASPDDPSYTVSAPISVFGWNQITAIFYRSVSTGTLSLYINGVFAATSVATTATHGPCVVMGIAESGLNGQMYDIRLWNSVLAPAYIAANIYTQYASAPGLVGLWNQFKNDGTLIYANQGSNGGALQFGTKTKFVPAMNQTIPGTPRAPQMMLQVSKDNGNTWGDEMWQSLGNVGEYRTRTAWLRLGRGRDFLFRLRVADPVPVAITGGAIAVR